MKPPPPLNAEGKVVQPPPEKSFLAKYWVYIAVAMAALGALSLSLFPHFSPLFLLLRGPTNLMWRAELTFSSFCRGKRWVANCGSWSLNSYGTSASRGRRAGWTGRWAEKVDHSRACRDVCRYCKVASKASMYLSHCSPTLTRRFLRIAA